MPPTASHFIFRIFTPTGDDRMSLKVSEALLRAQEHTATVRDCIASCLTGNNPTWRLGLTVEDTQPFDVDFAQLGKAAAIVRILRCDIDAILLIVADSAEDVERQHVLAFEDAVKALADSAGAAAVFRWIAGTPPPLAALLYLSGEPSNGLDMLGMCLADGFMKKALR